MPSHHRYVEDQDYGRDTLTRGTRRDRDGRDTRDREPVIRESRREPIRMDVEPQRISSRMMDTDMGGREPPQRIANAGVPLQDRRVPRSTQALREREDDVMYDARPSHQTSTRDLQGPRRPAFEADFDDLPATSRPVIDPGRDRDSRPAYNEYFLPGDGIDRNVIQSEICRYLGQDATCKPGDHRDGRRGYIIRAYRALTTEMIRSLKEDSAKYARVKEDASRRKQQPISFETFRDQSRYGDNSMDIDEPDTRYSTSRYDEPVRVRAPVTTTSYAAEPGYTTAYYPAAQTAPSILDTRSMDPRYVPGNNTPPSNRTPGYTSTNYGTATRGSIAAVPTSGPYTDVRGSLVRDTRDTRDSRETRDSGYGAYHADPRSRHHR